MGEDGEAMENLAAECATRRLEFRSCPVNSADTFAIVATVGIFSFVDYDAGM